MQNRSLQPATGIRPSQHAGAKLCNHRDHGQAIIKRNAPISEHGSSDPLSSMNGFSYREIISPLGLKPWTSLYVYIGGRLLFSVSLIYHLMDPKIMYLHTITYCLYWYLGTSVLCLLYTSLLSIHQRATINHRPIDQWPPAPSQFNFSNFTAKLGSNNDKFAPLLERGQHPSLHRFDLIQLRPVHWHVKDNFFSTFYSSLSSLYFLVVVSLLFHFWNILNIFLEYCHFFAAVIPCANSAMMLLFYLYFCYCFKVLGFLTLLYSNYREGLHDTSWSHKKLVYYYVSMSTSKQWVEIIFVGLMAGFLSFSYSTRIPFDA